MLSLVKGWHRLAKKWSSRYILASLAVGTQLFFLGCNQDNNRGSNFITKKKICLLHQKRKLATIEINKGFA